MSRHVLASPAIIGKAFEVFGQQIKEGLTPEAAVLLVLNEVLPIHAHELAEEVRREADRYTPGGQKNLAVHLTANLIDPEVSG